MVPKVKKIKILLQPKPSTRCFNFHHSQNRPFSTFQINYALNIFHLIGHWIISQFTLPEFYVSEIKTNLLHDNVLSFVLLCSSQRKTIENEENLIYWYRIFGPFHLHWQNGKLFPKIRLIADAEKCLDWDFHYLQQKFSFSRFV